MTKGKKRGKNPRKLPTQAKKWRAKTIIKKISRPGNRARGARAQIIDGLARLEIIIQAQAAQISALTGDVDILRGATTRVNFCPLCGAETDGNFNYMDDGKQLVVCGECGETTFIIPVKKQGCDK